jgi:hypothetical protein
MPVPGDLLWNKNNILKEKKLRQSEPHRTAQAQEGLVAIFTKLRGVSL